MTFHLSIHRLLVSLIYVIILVLSAKLFCLVIIPGNAKQIEILSLGAILSTFGAAIMALGSLFAEDKYINVKENIDILYNNIFKTVPWRRWRFLKRKRKFKLLSGDSLHTNLGNQNEIFDVGSHKIEITIPSVLKDFFDLPVIKNTYNALKYRKTFLTKYSRDMEQMSENERTEKREQYHNKLMAYECLLDSWVSISVYRLARYCFHSGVAIILSSVILTSYYILHA